MAKFAGKDDARACHQQLSDCWHLKPGCLRLMAELKVDVHLPQSFHLSELEFQVGYHFLDVGEGDHFQDCTV